MEPLTLTNAALHTFSSERNNGFLLFLVFLFGLTKVTMINAQTPETLSDFDQVISKTRAFSFDEALDLTYKLNDNTLARRLLQDYISLLRGFGAEDMQKPDYSIITDLANDTYLKSLAGLNSGLYDLLYDYNKESEAMKTLNQALIQARKINNKQLVCEIIKAVFIYHDRLLATEDYPEFYLDVYEKNTYDHLEKLIFSIWKFDLGFDNEKFIHPPQLIDSMEMWVQKIPVDFYKAFGYKSMGIFYDQEKEDYKKALSYHALGLDIIEDYKEEVYKDLKNALKINKAVVYFGTENYKDVIKTLKGMELKGSHKMTDYYSTYTNIWLSNSYKALGNSDSAYYYLEQNRIIRNKLNQTQHTAVVASERVALNTREKEHKIAVLDSEKKTLKNQILTLLPVLGIVSLLLIFAFFLYKRYKKRSEVLETEKSETLQKLDELKNIVIKNHITLKDKTKIYIADLIYIKSDDHYLNIFTSNGKNHFVRGKLSQIKEELPPNFIQCHRSYIVNINFVKQVNGNSLTLLNKERIPLSRSFKDKF